MLSTMLDISSGPASIGRKPGINFTNRKRVCLAASSSPQTRMSHSGVADRSCKASADTLWKAASTGVVAGTSSRACAAADPCQSLSIRVGLPPKAAARGTVASTKMAFAREPRILFKVSICAEIGTANTNTEACAAACAFWSPLIEKRPDSVGACASNACRMRCTASWALV